MAVRGGMCSQLEEVRLAASSTENRAGPTTDAQSFFPTGLMAWGEMMSDCNEDIEKKWNADHYSTAVVR